MVIFLAWAFNLDSVQRVINETPEQKVQRQIDEVAINAARQLVDEKLTSPTSARYREKKIVYRSGLKRIVSVIIDSKNAMGAEVRSRLCVAVELTSKDSTKFTFLRDQAIRECEEKPSNDELNVMRVVNGWTSDAVEKEALNDAIISYKSRR